MSSVVYEVYALKLAVAMRSAASNFVYPGAREGDMPMDFSSWLIKGNGRNILVDTGFSRASGRERDRHLDRTPAEALRLLGRDPAVIDTVVVTHLHYDHAGNLDEFPQAEVVIQAKEIAYTTGASMTDSERSRFFEAEDVKTLVGRVFTGPVKVIDGDDEIAPGVSVLLFGGHTEGLQVLTVPTERGTIVIASDALHYFENYTDGNPFPSVVDLERILRGYSKLESLVGSIEYLVPGHDPLIYQAYPLADASFPVAVLHKRPVGLTVDCTTATVPAQRRA